MKLELRPLAVFRLGARKVIQCRMIQGQPQDALRKSLIYRDGSLCVPLQLTGLSTAWGQDGTFDFTFEGPLEPPSEPSADAVLAAD